jgi:SulP family sulfate permease
MPRYLPKLVVCLREGYSARDGLRDLAAGLTVGVIALPLAMAFGIASIPESVARDAGISPPAVGLYTAVVAGFLISLLGGSRVQIGGPTGAFIVIVYGVASRHGYAGLATATLMAGAMVALLGLIRLGGMVKFIPYPVTTGFTSGIALIIFSSQVRDLAGLSMSSVPPDFLDKWRAYFEHAASWSGPTLAVGLGSLVVMLMLRRIAPRVPGAIVVVVAAALVVALARLPVETIGSRFGDIPRMLPAPRLPPMSLALMRDVLPDAVTIALLVAIESLLSAVVADGMTGGRHKADCELVAQGVANGASVLFGGIPATGAIARTAANVKSGGRTPVAGIIHAFTLLAIMLVAAPLARAIPLATLAAVLTVVAWNMSEIDRFRALLRAPRSDVAVLLVTFLLTVFVDLTLAVGVGMVLASMLFMKRMIEVSGVSPVTRDMLDTDDAEDAELADLHEFGRVSAGDVPAGVEIYEINGPFFFGVADRLRVALDAIERPPAVFVLRMRRVPAIDATGLQALEDVVGRCRRRGTAVVVSGLHVQPRAAFAGTGLDRHIGVDNLCGDIESALERARAIIAARGARSAV